MSTCMVHSGSSKHSFANVEAVLYVEDRVRYRTRSSILTVYTIYLYHNARHKEHKTN